MELTEYLNEIVDFLKSYLEKSNCSKYVLGLSGGVDSSLCAALIKKAVGKDKLLCLMMPIESLNDDLTDAITLANTLDISYKVVDATESYKSLLNIIKDNGDEFDASTKGNLKARLRMSILYAYAQKNHALVVGTDNMDERYTGYFTKFGDGAADLLPLVYLTKSEVVEASKILGIPASLAERVPSAGLFEGQTDEKEMGILYKDLDSYLLGNEVPKEVKEKIEHLHKISEHKRSEIPTPKPFKR